MALAIGGTNASPASAQSGCVADCNDDGVTTVDELIQAIDIAIGTAPLDGCRAADADGNGLVTVDELVRAVDGALGPCAAPEPTPTPVAAESVCGGPITSTPQVCQLLVVPDTIAAGEPLQVSFGISDLEGDVDTLCLGFGLAGSEPPLQCQPVPPSGALINGFGTTGELHLSLPAGDYTFALQVKDAVGHESNVATVNFSVTAP